MRKISILGLIFSVFLGFYSCKNKTETGWQKLNQELIEKYDLKERSIDDLPKNNITSNLTEGEVYKLNNLDSLQLQAGIMAKLFWGSGQLVANLNIAPNTKMTEESLPADVFLLVQEGEITQNINGKAYELKNIPREAPDGTHGGTPIMNFIYIEKGSKVSFSAGEKGAKLIEVYSPIRLDYLQKAGVKNLPNTVEDVKTYLQPNVSPNKVYDLYDVQLTKLADGAFTRLISGKNSQLSFISMDPNSNFPQHIHPEEQTMLILRGNGEETVLDKQKSLKKGDVLRLPGNMVHAAKIGELGSDVLDIFWPARPDYLEKQKTSLAAYHAIIPENATIELLVDGKKTKPELTFSEGPKWLNGKIYFSNMYFDQNFGASPAKSSTVELDPSGTYRNISQGKMQTNGLYPYKNGNLLVCDMMGHRVVEMTTKGEIVRVVADKFEGKPIDGPNDVITDSKGGFYFTDPQFTMEPNKFQPGRAVYYVNAAGQIKRIVEPNEFAMPNGILLSPDGKTLFINNCYDDESWFPVNSQKENFVWAYDVNEDGTIKNGRKFAQLHLTGEVLDRKGKSSSADGMAIDKQGNIYVCTYSGVQIFNNKGEFVGMINLPSFPVSLCSGGADMKTLYIVSYSKVFKIRTNMEGFVNYL
jgi:gluconolactonase